LVLKLMNFFDVIIIGGGINGCGIARDCAQRGLKVLLLEKGDFAGGTSGASSQMIHGGLRYLLSDVKTTELACKDSGYIQKIAPHLIFRIPFVYPVYQQKGESSIKAKMFLELLETLMERYDRYVPLKKGHSHCRLTSQEALELEPGLNPEGLVGAITFDEWGIDVARLCFLNAFEAVSDGALVQNHARVVGIIKEKNTVMGVSFVDEKTKQKKEAFAKYVVNACGPWAPQLAQMAGASIKLRPGKGVHLMFDRRISNMAINAKTIDGREVFLMPHENVSILGTTDDDYFGDLDDQRVLKEEVDYLMEAMAEVFPAIKKARMISSMSGVRPTLYARNVYEDDLSREHEIVDHGVKEGVNGFVSIIGGKLASYRIMSEEMTDFLCHKLGNTKACQTHEKPLPGAKEVPDVKTLAREFNLEPYLVSRLVFRHGSVARQICEQMHQNPDGKTIMCACEPVTQAEIDYVLRHEQVAGLDDLKRRTRLSMGPCQGMNCQLAAVAALQKANKIDDPLKELNDYRKKMWPNRAVILTEGQLHQEHLARAVMYTVLCLDKI
ncbi:MAG: hypothetical protein ACD_73C00774G0001, partial [uncultured bacterium]